MLYLNYILIKNKNIKKMLNLDLMKILNYQKIIYKNNILLI